MTPGPLSTVGGFVGSEAGGDRMMRVRSSGHENELLKAGEENSNLVKWRGQVFLPNAPAESTSWGMIHGAKDKDEKQLIRHIRRHAFEVGITGQLASNAAVDQQSTTASVGQVSGFEFVAVHAGISVRVNTIQQGSKKITLAREEAAREHQIRPYMSNLTYQTCILMSNARILIVDISKVGEYVKDATLPPWVLPGENRPRGSELPLFR